MNQNEIDQEIESIEKHTKIKFSDIMANPDIMKKATIRYSRYVHENAGISYKAQIDKASIKKFAEEKVMPKFKVVIEYMENKHD